jgi:hypothetical protein
VELEAVLEGVLDVRDIGDKFISTVSKQKSLFENSFKTLISLAVKKQRNATVSQLLKSCETRQLQQLASTAVSANNSVLLASMIEHHPSARGVLNDCLRNAVSNLIEDHVKVLLDAKADVNSQIPGNGNGFTGPSKTLLDFLLLQEQRHQYLDSDMTKQREEKIDKLKTLLVAAGAKTE